MPRIDPHSYFDDTQPRVRKLDLDLRMDFGRRECVAQATLSFDTNACDTVDLDTQDLEISSIRNEHGDDLEFQLGGDEPPLGRRLRVELGNRGRRVVIAYRTSRQARGLRWLAAAETSGGRHPLVYHYGPHLATRSTIPIQDTPSVRLPWALSLHVPKPLVGLAAAPPTGSRDGAVPGTRMFTFAMHKPVPPNLIAWAAGAFRPREVGPRSRVWAEPRIVESGAWQFRDIEATMRAAEELFGPYEWERCDLLILPPRVAWQGLESPCIALLSSALIEGDLSQEESFLHILAHYWTSNIACAASAEHAWLNEGWATWSERCLHERVSGVRASTLAWALGRKHLDAWIRRLGCHSPLTCLRMPLAGVDPADTFSMVPLEKGALFFALLEQTAGSAAFRAFMRDLRTRFHFQAITTADFVRFLEERLPGLAARVGAQEWIERPGLPANAPRFRSAETDAIDKIAADWAAGIRPDPTAVRGMDRRETQLLLLSLPRPLDHESCEWLDRHCGFTSQEHFQTLAQWLPIAARAAYEPAFAALRDFLGRVGTSRVLPSIYESLVATPQTRALARESFVTMAPRYHESTRRLVERALATYPD